MKKVLLIAIALIAIQVSAQERNERPKMERGPRMDKFQDFSPEEMATLQTKKMTLQLDLNESQQKAVQKLNLENAKERKARMEAHKAKMQNGTMEKPSKEERYKMMNDMLDHKIAMKAKMKQILNTDQYAKWEQSMEKMERRHKKMDRPEGMPRKHNKTPKQQ